MCASCVLTREKGRRVSTHLHLQILHSVVNMYLLYHLQILVKWALGRGVCVVPGARRRKHVADNMSVWDFTMNGDDVQALNSLNNNIYSHRDPRSVP